MEKKGTDLKQVGDYTEAFWDPARQEHTGFDAYRRAEDDRHESEISDDEFRLPSNVCEDLYERGFVIYNLVLSMLEDSLPDRDLSISKQGPK